MSKQLVKVTIPQDFDMIEWADKLKKLISKKDIEVIFEDRPEELWGSDPLIPQTKEHFEDMLHHLSKHEHIACDVETTGLSFVDPKVYIVGHVFTTPEKSFYVPIRHNTKEPQLDPKYVTEATKEVVYHNKDKILTFHNLSFDYNQLLKDGIDLTFRFFDHSVIDTQIMWWLLNETEHDDPWYYIIRPGQPAERTRYRQGFRGHAKKARELNAVKLQGYSLKTLGPKYIGIPMTSFDDLMDYFGFENLPIHFAGKYARIDGIATNKLREMGMPKIYEEKLEKPLFKEEMKFVWVNANMQRRGMGVHLEALEKLQNRLQEEQKQLEQEIYEAIGTTTFSTKTLTKIFIEDLGLPIFEYTNKGNPSFNAKAMDRYAEYLKENAHKYDPEKIKVPEKITRLKFVEKMLNTYIFGNKGIWANIDVDGRIHTTLHQTKAVTGRLSSSDPNLQNLPTAPIYEDELDREEMIQLRKKIGDLELNKRFDFTVHFLDEDGEPLDMEEGWEEKCVKVVERWYLRDVYSEKGYTKENREKWKHKFPRFGEVDAYVKDGKLVTIDLTEGDWLYLVGDYSQMELRMMAHLANEPSYIKAFEEGIDAHKNTASTVFDVPIDKVTKEQRQMAKAVNFGTIYGKTAYGFAVDWYSNEPDFWVPVDWNEQGRAPSDKYLQKAQEFIDKYFERLPNVKAYIESRQKMAMKNGYVRTITGRKRRLPEVFSENRSVRNRAMRQAINVVDQGCLHGDSRILTKQHGFAKIKDLVNQEIEVWDGQKFVKANVAPSGKKQLVEVVLQGNIRIKCSPDHRFLVRNTQGNEYFVRAENLKKQHYVVLTDEIPHWSTEIELPSIEGTSHNARNISIMDIKDPFERGLITGRIASKKLATELQMAGVKERIPEFIWADKECLRGYLQGIFDGDGNVTGNIRLNFGEKHRKLEWAEDIQKALLLFGIQSRIVMAKDKIMVDVSKKHTSKFMKKIGFLNPRKVKEGVALGNGQFANGSKIYGHVVNVKDVNITDEWVEMYDVVNSESGRFMTEGVITHNSSADYLKLSMIAQEEWTHEHLDTPIFQIMTVHDEVITLTRRDLLEKVTKPFIHNMTRTIKLRCPIVMDTSPAYTYGFAK